MCANIYWIRNTILLLSFGLAAPVLSSANGICEVATTAAGQQMLAKHDGIDLDHDGAREFLLRGDPDGGVV